MLADRLPGVPDGVDAAADGGFWVSLVAPIPPIAKLLKEPLVRAVYAWLPAALRPRPKPWGAVLKVRGWGRKRDVAGQGCSGNGVWTVGSNGGLQAAWAGSVSSLYSPFM